MKRMSYYFKRKKIMTEKTMTTLIKGNCLDKMKEIESGSIDMILTDPPYGTTACKWDSVIPFKPMWEQLERVTKKNGAIVFTASQPFTSLLVMSNLDMFKYTWVYKKRCASNFAQARYAPMKEHEDVLVFAKGKVNYYPIKEERQGGGSKRVKHLFSDATRHKTGKFVGAMSGDYNKKADELRYPSSIQEFNNRASGDRGMHPTQKPVALMEYLIKTYTNENETVLDFTMGSGTTGVACKNLNRNFIGIELDQDYFEIAKKRICKTELRQCEREEEDDSRADRSDL
jgi:site-specific DNA-methyltransferase (adenine-specific)